MSRALKLTSAHWRFPPVKPEQLVYTGLSETGALIAECDLPDLSTFAIGVMDEDLDPTPVPAGCHQCWLTAPPKALGESCKGCPKPTPLRDR